MKCRGEKKETALCLPLSQSGEGAAQSPSILKRGRVTWASQNNQRHYCLGAWHLAGRGEQSVVTMAMLRLISLPSNLLCPYTQPFPHSCTAQAATRRAAPSPQPPHTGHGRPLLGSIPPIGCTQQACAEPCTFLQLSLTRISCAFRSQPDSQSLFLLQEL